MDFNNVTAYTLEPDLTLNVAIRTARRPTNADAVVLAFDLRTIGALGAASKPEADNWYERAHETIIRHVYRDDGARYSTGPLATIVIRRC